MYAFHPAQGISGQDCGDASSLVQGEPESASGLGDSRCHGSHIMPKTFSSGDPTWHFVEAS